jgi:CII-binding regulator of phage lambda lysogenization HflD
MIDRDLHNLERKMENNIDNLRSELKEKIDYTSHKIEDLNRDIEPMLKNI